MGHNHIMNLYFIRFLDFSGEKQTFEFCNFCDKDACITRKKNLRLLDYEGINTTNANCVVELFF